MIELQLRLTFPLGMAYTRAENIQIDAWEAIGNGGWNWDTLFPYYKKSQNLQQPTEAEAAAGVTYDAFDNGIDGPLQVGWKGDTAVDDIHSILNETYANLNVPWNEDVNGGLMHGYNRYPSTVDAAANVREDAGRAYYYPVMNRTNLHLYTNTMAQRIVWASQNSSDGLPVASGVQVLAADSCNPYTISASKEVILSAGALVSPLLLELSGVGNPTILDKFNISVVVDLPTVGENLQDQTNVAMHYDTVNSTSYSGAGDYVAYPIASELFGSETANLSSTILAALPSYAEKVSAASRNVTKAKDLLELFKIQHTLIFSETHPVPIAEILVSPSGTIYDSEFWSLLPFSRGSIHINSAQAGEPALINPNYFMLDWDVIGMVGTTNFIRSLFATDPFASIVGVESLPGLDTVPANSTDAQWFDWVKTVYRSNYHPVATAAMMPQELGGVVDTSLKVYGTQNVRVIDASVLPFQVCGHLTSTLYAMSERVADMMKNELYFGLAK
jgi:choline dehydrogenase-like flavoprotein